MPWNPNRLRTIVTVNLLLPLTAACSALASQDIDGVDVQRDEEARFAGVSLTGDEKLWHCGEANGPSELECDLAQALLGMNHEYLPPYIVVPETYGECFQPSDNAYALACYISGIYATDTAQTDYPNGLIVMDEDATDSYTHETQHLATLGGVGGKILPDGSCIGSSQGSIEFYNRQFDTLDVTYSFEETAVVIRSAYAWSREFVAQRVDLVDDSTSTREKIILIMSEFDKIVQDSNINSKDSSQHSLMREYEGLRERFGDKNARKFMQAVFTSHILGEVPFGYSGLFGDGSTNERQVNIDTLVLEMRVILINGGFDINGLTDEQIIRYITGTLSPQMYSATERIEPNRREFYYIYSKGCDQAGAFTGQYK